MFLQKHRTVCLGSARRASTRTLDLRARRDVVTSWFGCRWPPRPQRRLLCQVEKHSPALTPEAPFSGFTIRTQPSTGLKRVWGDVVRFRADLTRFGGGLNRRERKKRGKFDSSASVHGEKLICCPPLSLLPPFFPLLLVPHGCPGVLGHRLGACKSCLGPAETTAGLLLPIQVADRSRKRACSVVRDPVSQFTVCFWLSVIVNSVSHHTSVCTLSVILTCTVSDQSKAAANCYFQSPMPRLFHNPKTLSITLFIFKKFTFLFFWNQLINRLSKWVLINWQVDN